MPTPKKRGLSVISLCVCLHERNLNKKQKRKKVNRAFVFACFVPDLHVFVCICILAVRWGQGNMRDILFRHIPSGADLMTRDLKMYMLGKEAGWEGG